MRAAVFYATREGQTRRIADRVATDLRARGVDVDIHNVKTLGAPVDWSLYGPVVVAASVHIGHHEKEMVAFVRQYRGELTRLRAAFLSVTLSEAGAEDVRATAERRRQSAADVQRMIEVFVRETGWQPAHVLPVAGALAYSQYNFLIKFVMRRIARKAGAPTDTSRDYELTDWSAVDRFVGELV